jgi:putative intracellular protease/amidase
MVMGRAQLRRIGLALGVFALLLSPATGLPAQPKVLVVARSQMWDPETSITKELMVMVDMLSKEGFTPVVASPEGLPFETGKTKVKSDLKFADVAVSDYVAIVLPCMSNPQPGSIPPELVKIVTDAAAANKPIAAQRSAIHILSKAGLLNGRKYAYLIEVFPEGIYSGNGVVQDGNIITSAVCPNGAHDTGKPDGTVLLMETFIRVLKAV